MTCASPTHQSRPARVAGPATATPTRWASLALVALLAQGHAQAQMKVGANPTTINANAVLEVESTTKGVLFPRVALSSTSLASPLAAHVAGMVVYNTATAGDVTPGLYQNTGSAWVALKPAAAASCTCGDIKQGLQTANHGDWKLMNGINTYAGNTCSLGSGAIPNASGLLMVQGGTVGTTNSATALTQANLPAVNLTASNGGSHTHLNPSTIRTTSTNGDHNHWYGRTDPLGEVVASGSGAVVVGREGETIWSTTATAGNHTHSVEVGNYNTNPAGEHGHTVPLGGSGTPLTTNNLPRLNVNYFVCVN